MKGPNLSLLLLLLLLLFCWMCSCHAWRLGHFQLSRKSPSSRLLHQWPRRKNTSTIPDFFPNTSSKESSSITTTATATSTTTSTATSTTTRKEQPQSFSLLSVRPSRRPIGNPIGNPMSSFHHHPSIPILFAVPAGTTNAIPSSTATITSTSKIRNSTSNITRRPLRRVQRLQKTLSIAILTMIWTLTDYFHPPLGNITPITSHTRAAAVLPAVRSTRNYNKVQAAAGIRNEQGTNSASKSLRILTASGILIGAVAGGSLLGQTIMKHEKDDHQTDTNDEDEDDVERENDIERESGKKNDIEVKKQDHASQSNGESEKQQDNHIEQPLTRQITGDGLLPFQGTPNHGPSDGHNGHDQDEVDLRDVGQKHAREMVKRILEQYTEETSKEKTIPSTANIVVANNAVVNDAVANSAVASKAKTPTPLSSFLPSTVTADIVAPYQNQQQSKSSGQDPLSDLPFLPLPASSLSSSRRATISTSTQSFLEAIQKQPAITIQSDVVLSPETKRASRLQQPKPPHEEAALQARYAAIPNLQERAYQILLDLGMLDGQ